MRTAALAAFLTGLLAPLAVVQQGPDPFLMERLLPPGALIYLSVPHSPSLSEDYARSNLRALAEHPEIRSFLEPIENWWRKRKNEKLAVEGREEPSWNDKVREAVGLSIDEIWDLLQGPLTFALYDVPLNEEHKLDLVLGLGAPDAAKLQQAAGRARETLRRRDGAGRWLEGEFTHRGTKVHELSAGEVRLYYGIVERTLVLTTVRERMEKILDAAGDRALPGLREDARFKDARARTAPDDRHLALLYLDVAGALHAFRKEIGDEGLKVLETFGVADITSAAAALSYDGPRLRERYALLTSQQTRGILKFLAGGTPVDAGASLVPAGALSYGHFGLNLAELYDVFMAAGKVSPDFDEEVGKAIREYEQRLGLNLREVLGTVGTSWTEYSALPEAGGAFPDSILAVTLADAAKFEAALEKIAADAKLPIEEMTFRGQKIRWITIDLGPALSDFAPLAGAPPELPGFGYAVAFFVREGMLFLSTNPLALKRQVLRLGRPAAPIAEDPRFQALWAKVAEKDRESWSYVDVGRTFNILYSTLEPFLHLARDYARDPQTGEPIADLARLPLGETLADLVGTTFTSKRTLPGAIVAESWSNTALASTSGVVAVAVAAAVAVPALLYREGGGGAAENERVALLTLHFIRQAQETFKNSDSDRNSADDYWTRDVAGLHGLKDRSGQAIFLLDPATAAADIEGAGRYGLQPAPKNGYFFKALTSDPDGQPYAKDDDKDGNAFTHKTRFGVAAYPAAYGVTGRLTYLISEEGKVYRKDTQGQPPDGWPGKDPSEQGWEKLD